MSQKNHFLFFFGIYFLKMLQTSLSFSNLSTFFLFWFKVRSILKRFIITFLLNFFTFLKRRSCRIYFIRKRLSTALLALWIWRYELLLNLAIINRKHHIFTILASKISFALIVKRIWKAFYLLRERHDIYRLRETDWFFLFF